MATSYTTLLGFALPVQGELSGTWGDTVNNYITTYLDSAIAGTQTLSTDVNVTLSKTTGSALGATSSQYAILNCTGARTALRTIEAPAASKIYTIINATTGGFGVKLVGAGPTTGVTIANGMRAVVAWNGTDFNILSIKDASDITPVANGGTGASSLSSITVGNATLATTATNLGGTTQWSTPYQSASGTTSYVAAGTTGYFYVSNSGGAPSWSNALPSSATINSNAVGYKEVPLLNQAPSTAITTADSGKSFYANAAGTWTIPANGSQAFAVGSVLTFINMNASACTIAITTDTMYLAGTGTTGSRTLAPYGMATAIKMTSTTWLISGSGLT